FSEIARVFETVLADRCALSSLLLRQSAITASGVYVDRQILGRVKANLKHRRRLRQNLLQLFTTIIASPLLFLRDQHPRKILLTFLMKAATLYGRWRGLRDKLFEPYRHISGI